MHPAMLRQNMPPTICASTEYALCHLCSKPLQLSQRSPTLNFCSRKRKETSTPPAKRPRAWSA
eukprot:1158331-Pelagomonas_calceolata.AAC.5